MHEILQFVLVERSKLDNDRIGLVEISGSVLGDHFEFWKVVFSKYSDNLFQKFMKIWISPPPPNFYQWITCFYQVPLSAIRFIEHLKQWRWMIILVWMEGWINFRSSSNQRSTKIPSKSQRKSFFMIIQYPAYRELSKSLTGLWPQIIHFRQLFWPFVDGGWTQRTQKPASHLSAHLLVDEKSTSNQSTPGASTTVTLIKRQWKCRSNKVQAEAKMEAWGPQRQQECHENVRAS